MKQKLIQGILALGLSFGLVQAKDLPKHKLSEWTVGETLFGDEAKLKKLKGKVVVIEYWGTR